MYYFVYAIIAKLYEHFYNAIAPVKHIAKDSVCAVVLCSRYTAIVPLLQIALYCRAMLYFQS